MLSLLAGAEAVDAEEVSLLLLDAAGAELLSAAGFALSAVASALTGDDEPVDVFFLA